MSVPNQNEEDAGYLSTDCSRPEFQKKQQELAAFIRNPDVNQAPEGIEERRVKIYRELFYNNIEGFISGAFPVLKEIINDKQWHELVRDFMVNHRCQTPYFLQISEEFLAYLQECTLPWLPEYSWQLAHWEWMELYADVYESSEPTIKSEQSDEVLLNCKIKASESAWCNQYVFPVHKLSAENSNLAAEETYLLVYRNHNNTVGFVELNPMSAALFISIKENTGAIALDILTSIAEQSGLDENQVTTGGKQILSQWQRLGVVYAWQ